MVCDIVDFILIEMVVELVVMFEVGCKSEDQFCIGIEYEKFGFCEKNLLLIFYEGDNGVKVVLEGMEKLLGWFCIEDVGNIIGLVDDVGGGVILIEFGGQFELLGVLLDNFYQIC